MADTVQLPLVDLTSPDRASTAKAIRQACIDYGFFYLINHGIEKEMFQKVFSESKKFFSLPLQEKMGVEYNKHLRGYNPIYSDTLDAPNGALKQCFESFFIGPARSSGSLSDLNQWPSEVILPSWRATMETYYEKLLTVGRTLVRLIALALDLDDQFFERIGAFHDPNAFLRLLHYPGDDFGETAHPDVGTITLLATDGVPGLQICREKERKLQHWENVHHLDGALIVNVGDLLERWTNCLFRSRLHRVQPTGKERYSVALFFEPNPDFVVECLPSCCSEKSPPRFPPIRSGDYHASFAN